MIAFLRCKCLSMDDYYDVEIFGYFSAVQQYFRSPLPDVTFKAMAFRAMKDSVLRERAYSTRAKCSSFTVGLDDVSGTLTDYWQGTEQQIADKALLEQAAGAATPKESKIINLLLDGFVLHKAAIG